MRKVFTDEPPRVSRPRATTRPISLKATSTLVSSLCDATMLTGNPAKMPSSR